MRWTVSSSNAACDRGTAPANTIASTTVLTTAE
jgi:hypothetical protein